MIARLYAACGPFGALVPRATGCVHWKPGAERNRLRKNATQRTLHERMTPEQIEVKRARNRAAAARSRERAKLASGGVVL